jgi:hypothetical protein
MSNRWLGNGAIQSELSNIMKSREVIWVQVSKSRDKPFWVRKARVGDSKGIKYWLDTLQWPYYSVGGFIGTNIINWEAMGELPPPLRSPAKTRKAYADRWNKVVLPKGCKELGLVWEDIWIGKTLLFDYDNPDNPLLAFKRAEDTARYLKNKYNATSYIVFSGSKGFHVHVGQEDTERITGKKPIDFIEHKDPLRQLGKHYAHVVEEIAQKATGVKFPLADRSSNFRQGIVRCPYTIHPKTGQIVWPIAPKGLRKLRSMEEATIMDVAKALHTWDIPCQSHIPEEGSLTYLTPESKCIDRGLIAWEE